MINSAWQQLQKATTKLVLKISEQFQSQLNECVQLVKDLTKFKHLDFPNGFFPAEVLAAGTENTESSPGQLFCPVGWILLKSKTGSFSAEVESSAEKRGTACQESHPT